jgi:hypothetical protein
MESRNKIYRFPEIVADLVAAFEACPVPLGRHGFHSDKSNCPQLTLDDLTPTDAFNFELARIWLRNFNPHQQVETERKFQWGSHQLVFPSGYRPEGGILILAAQSLGFEVVRHQTKLSERHNIQILLLNIENKAVIKFFRYQDNNAAKVTAEINCLCATPAVQMLLEANRTATAELLAQVAADEELERIKAVMIANNFPPLQTKEI